MAGPKQVSQKRSPFRAGAFNDVAFVIGAEASNIINVGMTFKDASGTAKAEGVCCQAYLSDDSAGNSIVATAPTTVAAGTNGKIAALVAGKVFQFNPVAASGLLDINITLSSGAATYYLVVVLPNGKRVVSGAITFAA